MLSFYCQENNQRITLYEQCLPTQQEERKEESSYMLPGVCVANICQCSYLND